MIKLIYIFIFCTLLAAAYSSINKPGDDKTAKPKKTYSRKLGDELVNVRVLSQTKATAILIAPQKGKYELIADGKNLMELDEQAILKATLINDSIELKTFENTTLKVDDILKYGGDKLQSAIDQTVDNYHLKGITKNNIINPIIRDNSVREHHNIKIYKRV